MNKVFVNQLKEKDTFATPFMLSQLSMNHDKNGKAFLSLSITDKSGSLNAMMWDNVETISSSFEVGDIFFVKGHIQNYQNKLQAVIHNIKEISKDTIDMQDYIKSTASSTDVMFAELQEIVANLQDDYIKQLIQNTLNTKEVQKRLLKYPAAKSIHHAYIGGLLEHTLSICKIMEFMAKHYPFVKRDLLIFGAIYHDIGKLWELSIEKGFQYTDRGRLVGHMQIACEMVDEQAGLILGFPQELKDILKHIILSHHGRLEYGSPKRPKFIEAQIVAMIDDLDSKVNSMQGLIQEEIDSSWTRYNSQFDRYLYTEIYKKQTTEE